MFCKVIGWVAAFVLVQHGFARSKYTNLKIISDYDAVMTSRTSL